MEAQTLGQLAETDLLHEIVPRVRGLHHLLQGDAVSGEDGDHGDGGHLGHEDAEQGGEADGLAGAVLGQRQSDVVEPGVGDGALLAAAVAQLAGQQPSERGLGGTLLQYSCQQVLEIFQSTPTPRKPLL